MGIDLTLTSKLPRQGLTRPSPAKFVRQLTDTAADIAGDHLQSVNVAEVGPGAFEGQLVLHPAAQALIVAVANGTVTLETRTSGAGPGYHRFICELADALAQRLNLKWEADDESGYFQRRDRANLEAEMLHWFQFLCQAMLEDSHPGDTDPLAITMPLGSSFSAHRAFAITPAGPRTREWMESIAKDRSLARSFFTWWSNPQSPQDMLDEALVWMWMESRWASPRTEPEARGFDRTLNLLATAHNADPTLNMPWREWLQLLAIATPDDPLIPGIKGRADRVPPTTPLIGYRRTGSTTTLVPGGWTVQYPANFSETSDEHSFIAFDDSRTIRISSMSGQRDGTPIQLPPPHPDRPPSSPLLTRPTPAGRASAYIAPETEDGHTYQQLTGEIVAMDDTSLDIGILTVAFEDPNHRDWAIAVWNSFTQPRKYQPHP